MRFRSSRIDLSSSLDGALRRLRPERPPALLLGGGLNLLRPLGFAGIPAIVASPDPRDPTIASRYCGGHCLIPPPRCPEAAMEALLAVGDRIESAIGRRAPLFYGNDDYLNLIYAFRDELAQRFLLLLNEPDVAHALIDKDRFEVLARQRGLTVPRTLTWDDAGSDALSRAEGPVLVKPRMKVGWDDSTIYLQLLGGKGKARVFENAREVMAHPLAHQFRDQLTFQEFIGGDDRHLWSFHGVADENGTLLAGFTGHKLRTSPPLTGMSSYLELTHDEELAAMGRDIVARIPLKGVFKIDFKKDAVNGRSHVLEINARFNLWHHMAAKNGVNLLQVAYDYLVDGKRPADARYRTTFRWLCFPMDYRAFRELASRDELTFSGWLLSLLASRKVYDLFSWSDPVPFLCSWRDRASARLRRGFEHFTSWLQQWLSTAL